MQGPALFGDRADTANTGADANADALAVIVGNFETGVADRLFGGRNTVMNKRIGALDVLDAQPLLGVEVPDHATEPGDRKSTRLNSSHSCETSMPPSA